MNQPGQTHPPWYRQFWPWVIIAIPAMAVIGGIVTFWLAVSNPETLVVDDARYQQIRSELRAQDSSAGPDGDPRDKGESERDDDRP